MDPLRRIYSGAGGSCVWEKALSANACEIVFIKVTGIFLFLWPFRAFTLPEGDRYTELVFLLWVKKPKEKKKECVA
ncbi:hypothetical protein HMPREF0262_03209 [Clostridium sp. ATCC 29733]|nr:hypothetical protein HMPREF0262_03209 [Clostridium sp. ATCC 29733]